MLLIHRFGTLNTLFPGHYILRQVISLLLLDTAWAWNTNTDENVQPTCTIDCKMVTKYSAMIVAFPGHSQLLFIYTIIDFIEVDIRIYLPESYIDRAHKVKVNITFKGR